MRRLVFLILIGVTGGLLVRHFAFEGIYLASNSMAPTLSEGAHVFVNKYAFLFRSPRRGEIIMFDSPIEVDKGLVKRVIAVAGDTVEIHNKRVSVNGSELVEPYVQFVRADALLLGDNLAPITVPADQLFVLGDNRDVSGDSRDWKAPDGHPIPFVPISTVHGLVREQ
jgi:signal peptidase I